MDHAPLLPLSPRQLRTLAAATRSSVAGSRPSTGPGRLPRVPERVLVALVGVLRAETGEDRRAPGALRGRARAGSRAAVTGAFGAAGLVPTEVVGLVEQARAGVAVTVARYPSRSDEQVAADLLVAWGLLDDPALAEAVADGTAEQSLLDALVVRGGRMLREAIPERWTPWTTLRLIWRMRQLPGLRDRFSVKGLRSRGLQAIPVLGAVPAAYGSWREMSAFQRRLTAHHRTLGVGRAARPQGRGAQRP